MDKLNEKYTVTKDAFVSLINLIAVKRRITTKLSTNDSNFEIIKKLNKIFLMLQVVKLSIGYNILEEEISNLISIDKNTLTQEEYEKLYIYIYFYNSIKELNEMPAEFAERNLKWQFIKVIQEDKQLKNSFSYIDGNIYLNKK